MLKDASTLSDVPDANIYLGLEDDVLQSADFPCIVVIPEVDNLEGFTASGYLHKFKVWLLIAVLHYKTEDKEDDGLRTIHTYTEAAYKEVFADTTLGGNADDTKVDMHRPRIFPGKSGVVYTQLTELTVEKYEAIT